MSTVVEPVVFVDEWRGLYSESWKGVIVDEAFAHPAKFSRALIRKIYDHVIAEGWATKGSSVVDPFGGVALGGFDAMRHGLNWTGCELEAKFVSLGGQNIALWNERFSRMPNWGTARLIQGDSRKLGEVLSGAECCVSSPPYANDTVNERNGIDLSLIKKPGGQNSQSRTMSGYGEASGQLGGMKEGDHSIAISSPPFEQSLSLDRPNAAARRALARERGISNSEHISPIEMEKLGKRHEGDYGVTPGNLGNMRGGFEAANSSPPYEGIRQDGAGIALESGNGFGAYTGEAPDLWHTQRDQNNIGNLKTGETFWSASRLILKELHQVLAPNAHAVFVVKAFVRDKKIVDFPAQWAQLCEVVGFKLLHDHHALLTEHYGTQGGFEGDKTLRVERKSFFRRLAESKGSPRIDYENVLCFRKVA